jgi:hypothetical protein
MTCVFLCTATHAANQLALSPQIGTSHLYVGNSTLKVTETETDQLKEITNYDTPEASIGLSYTFPFKHTLSLRNTTFFPNIKIALNYRYLQQDVTGNVYQYMDPIANNYHYKINVNSMRLMLDSIITLFTICDKNSLYLLGGIGNAWNQIRYQDFPNTEIIDRGGIRLNKKNSNGFTYEVGAGALYSLTKQIDCFVEYRYAHFKEISTASQGIMDGMPITVGPAHFPLRSQTVSLGMNWNFY